MRARVFNAVREDFERSLAAACLTPGALHITDAHVCCATGVFANTLDRHARGNEFEFVYKLKGYGLYATPTTLSVALKEALYLHKSKCVLARRSLPAERLLTRVLRARGCCRTDAQGWLYDTTRTSLRLNNFLVGA